MLIIQKDYRTWIDYSIHLSKITKLFIGFPIFYPIEQIANLFTLQEMQWTHFTMNLFLNIQPKFFQNEKNSPPAKLYVKCLFRTCPNMGWQ